LLGDAAAGLGKLVLPTLAHYEILNVLSRAGRGLKKGQELSSEEAQEISCDGNERPEAGGAAREGLGEAYPGG